MEHDVSCGISHQPEERVCSGFKRWFRSEAAWACTAKRCCSTAGSTDKHRQSPCSLDQECRCERLISQSGEWGPVTLRLALYQVLATVSSSVCSLDPRNRIPEAQARARQFVPGPCCEL
eukprot:1195573-Rhodomonas_salina.4